MSDARETLENHADWLDDRGGQNKEIASMLREVLAENERLRSINESLIRAHENELDNAQRAEARIEAALALHKPSPGGGYCDVCDEVMEPEYPCSTVKALKGGK